MAAWLGLKVPNAIATQASIEIHIAPPVELILNESQLSANKLKVTLHAHPNLDVDRVGVAIRTAPSSNLSGRSQAASSIKWGRVRNARRLGVANVAVGPVDSALVMLRLEDVTIRRQWFLDPAKARNRRLLAVQHFDKDLRMLKQAIFEMNDSAKFENGVALLLFLLGFAPAVQIETDAPDLVVSGPNGELAVVECTTRVADFSSKIGRLVDRRGALAKRLADSDHPADVHAVLVCRLPRDQIASQSEDLHSYNVVLLAREELVEGFDRVRYPGDPEAILRGMRT